MINVDRGFQMNEQQQQLYEQLVHEPPTPAAKGRCKRTLGQFVVEYGWWYEPSPLSDGFDRGPMQHCHKNAHELAKAHDGLIYCEGFAVFNNGGTRTLHAWVTDGQGRAFDNTWQKSGVAYAGVPFKSSFVTMTTLKNLAAISLLDDWQNDYPFRGELGDSPEEWLEKAGSGLAKITS